MRSSRGARLRRTGAAAALVALALAGCGGSPSTAGPADRSPTPGGSTAASSSATSGAAGPSASSSPSAAAPCGHPAPTAYRHVVWIWMENKGSSAIIGSRDAPFENALARRCGLAADYHGITHPSLPNYLAATGGSTFGVSDDRPPAAHPVSGDSVFAQAAAAGLTWRAYEESMPSPCRLTDSGRYAVRHNPAAYFTSLRPTCGSNDVGFDAFAHDIASGSLPAFAFVTPDLCHDTHDCSVATGDTWLRTWLTRLLDGPNYATGDTLVVLTWDEAEGGGTTVPAIVVAPSVPPGTVSHQHLDHYSLLRTTEDLLGLPPLRQAAGATSMAPAFRLGSGS